MSEKQLYGIRGTCCTENTAESIVREVCSMCGGIFKKNSLLPEDIVSIQFTVTKDIDAMNPAAALRHGDCGIDVSSCALFCSQEAEIQGSLPHTIRVLITAYMKEHSLPVHIYRNGAEVLRPDFAKGKQK